jgi:predicted RNase H-like nuclease (RuvC/YqgF family)
MVSTHDIILKLKAVREEKGLSLNEILAMVEENKDYISRSSIQRVFAEGSEDSSFRYEETIRPIAKALLDIETIEEDDSLDTATLKALLKYKIQRIEDLENQLEHLQSALDNEKLKRHEKIDDIRAEYEKKIDFLKEQITLKDKRMDLLLNALLEKEKPCG